VDKEHDLAIIRSARFSTHPKAKLGEQLPALGETVYNLGHPSFLYWTYVEGKISAYRGKVPFYDDVKGPMIQFNGTVFPGSSGGGLFDKSGKLIGICSRLTKVQGMSMFIHLETIKAFIGRSYR
jgi:S1-C subfamily serine protease